MAALAAQTAARSSTSVPGQLLPAQPLGEGEGSGDDSGSVIEALAAPVVAGGMAFSATLLVWATRAGGLVAAMMASVPAWRSLDPLPILERANRPDADDEADGLLGGATGAAPEPNPDDLAEAAAGEDPFANTQQQAPLRALIEPLEMLR